MTGRKTIGKIQDIVWGGGKTLKGYILSVGGFLGMGTHYVAVDPAAVEVTYDANSKNGERRRTRPRAN